MTSLLRINEDKNEKVVYSGKPEFNTTRMSPTYQSTKSLCIAVPLASRLYYVLSHYWGHCLTFAIVTCNVYSNIQRHPLTLSSIFRDYSAESKYVMGGDLGELGGKKVPQKIWGERTAHVAVHPIFREVVLLPACESRNLVKKRCHQGIYLVWNRSFFSWRKSHKCYRSDFRQKDRQKQRKYGRWLKNSSEI